LRRRGNAALSFALVPAYLIRHAHAGSRSAWRDDDDLRPLSPKGRAQAEALRRRLKDDGVGHLLSSPAQRCIETLEPLAARCGLRIEVDKRLAEGADADEAVELLLRLVGEAPVLCTHGDLVPKIIRRLVAAGMKTKDANISQKGSLWVVDFEGRTAVRGRYFPPG
jgi:phosphohistidine phosphatase SixA